MTTKASRQFAELRRRFDPETEAAFQAFGQSVFSDGALCSRTKRLIALGVALAARSANDVATHARAAQQDGATAQELIEAAWVAAAVVTDATLTQSVSMVEALTQPVP